MFTIPTSFHDPDNNRKYVPSPIGMFQRDGKPYFEVRYEWESNLSQKKNGTYIYTTEYLIFTGDTLDDLSKRIKYEVGREEFVFEAVYNFNR